MIEAYPLYWPEGWPRIKWRSYSNFKTTFGKARDSIVSEVRRLGGRDIIISTNIPLRNDGLPYATYKTHPDPGVAVYFTLNKNPMVFACDKYNKLQDNLQSINKTIEAIRGIKRWGASDMMERAFRGFQALPPSAQDWRQVLEVSKDATSEEIKEARNRLASKHHPDRGGDPNMMAKINEAYKIAVQK